MRREACRSFSLRALPGRRLRSARRTQPQRIDSARCRSGTSENSVAFAICFRTQEENRRLAMFGDRTIWFAGAWLNFLRLSKTNFWPAHHNSAPCAQPYRPSQPRRTRGCCQRRCKTFAEIYAGGKELCENMWTEASGKPGGLRWTSQA